VIGPGDELLIRTWGQVTQNLHLTVDRSGSVYVPQVGELRVAGLQFRQLQEFLEARLERVYRQAMIAFFIGRSVKECSVAIAPIGVHKPW